MDVVDLGLIEMKEYRTILRRVGWVLVIGGLIDIGFMVYCIANNLSYASSFNIFAVIGGIFLLNNSLRAARITSFFIAFLIAVFIGIFVVVPFLYPIDLLVVQIKLAPIAAMFSIIFITVLMVLLVWIYRELTSQPVRTAMNEAGVNHTSFWRKPARGFWIGGCLPLFLLIFLSLLLNCATADEAKRRAAIQVGGEYKYHVKSLSMSSGTSGKYVRAVVTAYNDTEIKDVVIEWSE